jgi:hypothetical protein
MSKTPSENNYEIHRTLYSNFSGVCFSYVDLFSVLTLFYVKRLRDVFYIWRYTDNCMLFQNQSAI